MWHYKYTNELYHFGVKGMKWGVRKYQNKDGSLTKKGQKRYAKNESYRQKLIKKAQSKSENAKYLAEEAKFNVKDLETRGVRSKAYREWKEERYDARERKYEFDNRIYDDGDTYVKKYSRSPERFADDFFDAMGSRMTIAKLIDENRNDANLYNKEAKRWMNNKTNLMNMEVSVLTNKKDIKRVYKG